MLLTSDPNWSSRTTLMTNSSSLLERAHLGRALEAHDDGPIAAYVVVSSNAMWSIALARIRDRLSGRCDALGILPHTELPRALDATLHQSRRKRRPERMGLVPIGAAEARGHMAASADAAGPQLSAGFSGSPNLGIGGWDRRSHGCAIRPTRLAPLLLLDPWVRSTRC